MDPNPEEISALIEALGAEDVTVRKDAASALHKMGPDAKEAIPALIGVLKDQSWEVRWSASEALANIGESAVAALIAALKDADVFVRGCAATILGEMGLESRDAVPALTKILKDGDRRVRKASAEALKKIAPTTAADSGVE